MIIGIATVKSYLKLYFLQRIHKHDPVIVSDQYLFGSVWKCHNNKHYLNSLLESDKCTRVKIIHSLTNPCQTRNLVENYTSGQIPFDNKKVEIYLVTEKSYGEVVYICIYLILPTKANRNL